MRDIMKNNYVVMMDFLRDKKGVFRGMAPEEVKYVNKCISKFLLNQFTSVMGKANYKVVIHSNKNGAFKASAFKTVVVADTEYVICINTGYKEGHIYRNKWLENDFLFYKDQFKIPDGSNMDKSESLEIINLFVIREKRGFTEIGVMNNIKRYMYRGTLESVAKKLTFYAESNLRRVIRESEWVTRL